MAPEAIRPVLAIHAERLEDLGIGANPLGKWVLGLEPSLDAVTNGHRKATAAATSHGPATWTTAQIAPATTHEFACTAGGIQSQ